MPSSNQPPNIEQRLQDELAKLNKQQDRVDQDNERKDAEARKKELRRQEESKEEESQRREEARKETERQQRELESVLRKEYGTSDQQALDIYHRAQNAFFKGKKIKLLRQAVEIAPAFHAARFELGNLYFDNNEFRRAAQEFEAVKELCGSSYEILRKIACSYANAGEYSNAISAARELDRIQPGYPKTKLILGELNCQLGNLEEALTEFEKARELSSWLSKERASAKEGIENVKRRIQKKETAETVERALSGEPSRVKELIMQGDRYFHQREWVEAMRCFYQAAHHPQASSKVKQAAEECYQAANKKVPITILNGRRIMDYVTGKSDSL